MEDTLAVILEQAETIAVKRIPIPPVPGRTVRVEMRACGICGSDVRYLMGENPWSLHTLGRAVASPPNMVLGHEVAGVVPGANGQTPVAILAYRACGRCVYCTTGRENLCDTMEHFGHSAGWSDMPYYPGGMSERFDIWDGFAYELPANVPFEEATFLDGLGVAVHAVDRTGLAPGGRIGVLGLGPIGLLAAQAASAAGAAEVFGCDTAPLPVEMAARVGLPEMVHGDTAAFLADLERRGRKLDAVVDTVGSADSIRHGLAALDKSGALLLLAVRQQPVPIAPISLAGERRILTSSNNPYKDFPRAIELLASGKVKVTPLITHRFSLAEAPEAFRVMLNKEAERAYKVVLHP